MRFQPLFGRRHVSRSPLIGALALVAGLLLSNSVRAEDPLQIGDFQVTPGGSRLFMSVVVGESPSPDHDDFQVEDADEPFLTQMDFNQSDALDLDDSGSFGDHTAHTAGALACHVTHLGNGGVRCTISGSVEAEVTDSVPPPIPYPLADALADTYFAFAFPETTFCDWSYACQIHIDDQSDQKDQAHAWVSCPSSFNNGTVPSAIPPNLVLGGLVTNDGVPPSAQQDADINVSGSSVFSGVVTLAPRIQVSAKQSGRPVSIQMTITLTFQRVSGACCIPAQSGTCFTVPADYCASYNGSIFGGADTDCAGGTCPDAAEIHWVAPLIGDFGTAASWNPQKVPESNPAANPPRHDIAMFDLADGYTVTFNGSRTSERAVVRAGSVEWMNATYHLQSADPVDTSLSIGPGADLRINSAADVTLVNGVIGEAPGAEALLSVYDSKITASGFVLVGRNAPGKLVLESGVLSDSVLTLNSLQVGRGSKGTMEVQAGQKVTCDVAWIGLSGAASSAVSESVVTVDGRDINGQSASLHSDGDLIVGATEPGRLEVTNGADVFAKYLIVGETATTGKVMVTGDPNDTVAVSNLAVSNDRDVGQDGDGELTIKGNPLVIVGGATTLGKKPGRLGSLQLQDEATCNLGASGNKLLTVGDHGNGILSILSGASLTSRSCSIGLESDGDGTVLVQNGPSNQPAWEIDGDLDIGLLGGSGKLTIDSASVHVTGDLSIQSNTTGTIALTPTGKLTVDGEGHINAQGHLIGAGLYDCHFTLFEQGGEISPGLTVTGAIQPAKARSADSTKSAHDDVIPDPIGTLTMAGDVKFADGCVLRIDVSGLDDGQFDVLHVTGNAVLGGTLEVHFINGFTPRPNDLLKVLQVDGTLAGEFASVTLDQGPGLQAFGRFTNGTFELTVTGDGAVGAMPCGVGLCGVTGFAPMMLALMGLGAMRRRRSHRSPPTAASTQPRRPSSFSSRSSPLSM